MKKLFIISVVAILLISLAGIPCPVSAQTPLLSEVWVDDDWDGYSSGTEVEGHIIGTDAFATIQEGIDAVTPSGTVNVAAGTYEENIIVSDKPVIKLLGAGAEVTTIIGDGTDSVVTGSNMNSGALIEGFTITGGQAADPTYGGGLFLPNAAMTIARCKITGNGASHGGGIYMSDEVGTGFSPQVINCLITNNNASTWGSGIFFYGSALSPTVMNCTIADNTAGDGVGVYNLLASVTITNSIIYGNSTSNIFNNPAGGTSAATYSCIGLTSGVFTGEGNINADPLFVGSGDYHLGSGSPCIDTGDPDFTGPPSIDLDGNSRIASSVVDMGAYEYGSSDGQPPTASNPSPADGSYTAYTTPDISVDLADDESGVDGATIALTVNGTVVAHGWDGSTVSYTPTVDFAIGQVVDVSLDASDVAGNPMDTYSWSFTVSPEYTLTIDIDPTGGGSVGASPAGPYHYGDIVQLTAVDGFGYVFDHWGGDLTGSANPASITMSDNKSVTAYFMPSQYTLTISVDPTEGGTVEADPDGPYHLDDVVELTAVPSAGYYFDHWDGDGDLTGSANPASITMSGDKNVTAYFTLYEYTLTIDVDPTEGGTVSVNQTGPYHYGDIVQLNAEPDVGYIFDHWDGDLTGSANPASITIDGNESVTAYFMLSEYTLTIGVDPSGGGTVSANLPGPYNYNDVVELTALPGTGYYFDHWDGDLTGSANPASITIDGNESVTAYFTLYEYTLTTSVDPSDGGAINVDPAGPYHYGDIVELEAVADFGYVFDHWGGDLTGSANPASITMSDNKSVTAYFMPSEYTLTIGVDPAGSGMVSVNQTGPYHLNDVVGLTAEPGAGYYFDHWGGDLTGSDNPASITMSGNKSVTAYFALIEYTLTTIVDPSGGGTISANLSEPYHLNDVVELTAVPDVGYIFDHWDGDLTGSDNPASITMSGDKSVTAYFFELESAYDIKSDAISKLEDAKGEDRLTNRRIDRIIWFIRASLNNKYWEDNEARLDARHGNRVFNWEMAAATSLQVQIRLFERQIPALERMIAWKESRGISTDREEASLAAIQAALPVFQEVLGDLAEADRVLAKVAIEDAKNTPVQNPRFNGFYNRYIDKAESSLDMAMQLLDSSPSRAIMYFEKAWQYAQRAISFAGRS